MNDLTPLQQRALVEISQHMRGNEITGAHLASIIGLKERDSGKEGADMRSIIHALRVKQYPICANGKGYFYALTSEELSAYINSLIGRMEKEQQACDGLKNSFENVGKRFVFRQPESPNNPQQQLL